MPHWLPAFAAAASAVLVLNIALMVQRVREQSKTWPARFLRDLRRWDGRLPDDLDQHVALSSIGGAPLRSGFVENVHADGPNVYATNSTR